MKKNYIVQDLYEMSHLLDGGIYVKYKNCMCKTLLWRAYAFTWRVKYIFNLIMYKITIDVHKQLV